MTETELEATLYEAIFDSMEPDDVRTFEDAGVLTNDRGLVVRVGDDEFQITIVRSR